MAFKGIENNTPFATEMAVLCDERGRDMLVLYTKASFNIEDATTLKLAPEQLPVNMAGEYLGEPGKSSMLNPPECSFAKLGTDVALIGHAHAPGGQPVTVLNVSFKVGSVGKTICVFGDRYWHYQENNGEPNWVMDQPQEFTAIPLVYERAFGGFDDSAEEEKDYEYSDYNPIGAGLIAQNSALSEAIPLPNLEVPDQLITNITDRPPPAGFGFICPDWEPRRQLAGTYDEEWENTRSPLLPVDFNYWFFNAAHPDLRMNGYLQGNETIEVTNASTMGTLKLELPAYKPKVALEFLGKKIMKLECQVDTLLVNTDKNLVQVLWRTELDVTKHMGNLVTIKVNLAKIITPDQGIAA